MSFNLKKPCIPKSTKKWLVWKKKWQCSWKISMLLENFYVIENIENFQQHRNFSITLRNFSKKMAMFLENFYVIENIEIFQQHRNFSNFWLFFEILIVFLHRFFCNFSKFFKNFSKKNGNVVEALVIENFYVVEKFLCCFPWGHRKNFWKKNEKFSKF
jgi:hypothetical protein